MIPPVTPVPPPLLEVTNLQVAFHTAYGSVPAVRGVNFTLNSGETLAIVGESGSGKSTTATAIIRLLAGSGRITGGEILFNGRNLLTVPSREMESIRGRDIGFVPQDPMSNLNPVWNIGFQVEEAVRANGIASGRKDVRAHALRVLKDAGLSDAKDRLKQFPHQFSGGMRQRVLIAMALAAKPQLLIADEPTSALDVTVQRVILDHLETLTKNLGTAVLFITHDLGLAAERAEKLIVMYRGKIVESGPSVEILQKPLHPYTQRLVAAAPSLASRRMTVDLGRQSRTEGAHVRGEDRVQVVEERPVALERQIIHEGLILSENTIEVSGLTKVFKVRQGSGKARNSTAVDNVSFSVKKGTTMALVGESGSGKSTVAKMILKLEPATAGTITIDGTNITHLKGRELFALRRRMQPVFQDPYGSLNPLHNIGTIISEPLRIHKVGSRNERRSRVKELLDHVALPQRIINRYPNELSGGQRQRVAIARALALQPEIVILDEAVSALDVLVQTQILQLLNQLQHELGLTYLFITHDLAVVRVIADTVCVMRQGRIIETASTDYVFTNPTEQYTKDLLNAIPGAGIPLGI